MNSRIAQRQALLGALQDGHGDERDVRVGRLHQGAPSCPRPRQRSLAQAPAAPGPPPRLARGFPLSRPPPLGARARARGSPSEQPPDSSSSSTASPAASSGGSSEMRGARPGGRGAQSGQGAPPTAAAAAAAHHVYICVGLGQCGQELSEDMISQQQLPEGHGAAAATAALRLRSGRGSAPPRCLWGECVFARGRGRGAGD